MSKTDIPLEKNITGAIMKRLKVLGYSFVVKLHGAGWQTAGLPDIMAIAKNGRFVGLEVKRPSVGKVTDLQRRMLENINKAGGYAVVVRTVEDAERAMQEAENGKGASIE